jgi:hypothetical protein
MLIGSVAGNLVRHSTVPVMVVSKKYEPQDWFKINYREFR